MNKLQTLLSAKWLILFPFIFLFACERIADNNNKDKELDNKNILTSLVLTLSSDEEFEVVELNHEAKTGKVGVPHDAKLEELKVKSLEFSPEAQCSLNVGSIIPLDSSNDTFKVTVTPQDGTEAIYTITINKLSVGTASNFISFEFLKKVDPRLKEDVTFNVNSTNITGDDINYIKSNELIPVFKVSPGATVEVNGAEQTSGNSTVDFTSPVIYTVISKDKKITKTYTVTVNFYYFDLKVLADGTISRTDPSRGLFDKLILADKMNGYTVKSIADNAFEDCTGLTELSLPNTLESIGKNAFKGCTGFKGNLNIPNTVKSIGEDAFYNCGFDGTLTLPNSLEKIEKYAFKDCTGFKGNLNIPNTVKSIGEGAFYDCGFDGTLTLSNKLESIGKMAFQQCEGFNGTLTLPDSIKTIGNGTFLGCKGFNVLVFPKDNKLTRIENSTFKGCSGFSGNLTIPDGITYIGYGAFQNCSGFNGALLTIPASVQDMDNGAFHWSATFAEICNKSNLPTDISNFYGVTGAKKATGTDCR